MSEQLKKVEVRLKLTEGNGLYSNESIDNAEKAVRVMAEAMAGLDREEVCVVNLDGKGHPINFNVVSIGSLNGSIISMGNVFKTALLTNAASILLLHNHPSTDVSMSRQDESVTKQLMYAGQIMGIAVLDHIIVGGMTGSVTACAAITRNYLNRIFMSKDCNTSVMPGQHGWKMRSGKTAFCTRQDRKHSMGFIRLQREVRGGIPVLGNGFCEKTWSGNIRAGLQPRLFRYGGAGGDTGFFV